LKDILKSVIVEFQQRELPSLKKRGLKIDMDVPMVITLTGVRRSGKTYLLYHTISKLVAGGVPMENILFLNFEDERLSMQTTDLDLILQSYAELYPDKNLSACYLFFDEIQNVPGWEKFVRRVFDNYTRHIFITGSNARLLSTEIAGALRGRTITYTVYPLSFEEYLDFHGITYDAVNPSGRAKAIHHARQFVMHGGFPETIPFHDDVRMKVLQSYFNTMIFRDIVERYKINDVQVLKFFIKKLFANIGKPLSVNKIYNDLRSQGYKVSNNYLYEFEQYVYAVFLGIPVPKFSYSEIKQAKSEKKLYAIDTGLLSAVEFSMSENRGKLLENTVLLELVKAGHEVFYFKERYECDFIVREGTTLKAMQVAWQIEDDTTQKREIRGLVEACQKLNLQHGQVICFDHKKRIETEGVAIDFTPFHEWSRTISGG
jgi:predicted AAA+ superfamily ATPase